jgi:hypothetical protein
MAIISSATCITGWTTPRECSSAKQTALNAAPPRRRRQREIDPLTGELRFEEGPLEHGSAPGDGFGDALLEAVYLRAKNAPLGDIHGPQLTQKGRYAT